MYERFFTRFCYWLSFWVVLNRYLHHGIECGSFLNGCIEINNKEKCMRELDFTQYSDLVHLEPSLNRYLKHGIECGSFLNAVLENDLTDSFGCADFVNRRLMLRIVEFMYNEFPNSARGSKENVKKWIGHRGYDGL